MYIYTPEIPCMKGTSVYIKNMRIKQRCNQKVLGFATAFRLQKLFRTLEKEAGENFSFNVRVIHAYMTRKELAIYYATHLRYVFKSSLLHMFSSGMRLSRMPFSKCFWMELLARWMLLQMQKNTNHVSIVLNKNIQS